MNHSIVASSQMGWRKRERESEWAKDREIRRVWVKVRCWHGQPRNQLAFPAVILPLALTPSLPLPRATLHGYLSFPFSQGHSSHFIVFHFKCVHLIMRLVSAANTKKKRMKSEKSRERKAQKITAATAASQKYIPYIFWPFFGCHELCPRPTVAQLETYVQQEGRRGGGVDCGVAAIVQLVSCEFWAKFWANATVLSVLHVALESRRQHVTCRMWHGRRLTAGVAVSVKYTKTRATPHRVLLVLALDLMISQIPCKSWDEIKQRVFKSTLKYLMRTGTSG